MLVTEKLKQQLRDSCLTDLRKIGITDIDSSINSLSDLEYIASLGLADYIGMTQSEFLEKVTQLKDLNDDAELKRVKLLVENTNKLSIYWILCNGVRFALDLDSVIAKKYEPDQEVMNLLKKTTIEDYIFDFFGEGVREQCRLQKQHDLIRINDKFYTHWIFSYSVVTTSETFGTFELVIVPELFPKIFVADTLVTDICKKCGICKKVEDACFKHTDGSMDSSIQILRMPKNLQYTLESNCHYKHVHDDVGPFLKRNIRDYLTSCLYAVSKYLKRKTIVKQKGDDEINDFIKVAVPKENKPTEVTFVTLRDRVKYERKQKRIHSHHASPREHVRRSTERHLKDGRVIPVRGCIINKGKGNVKKQTVYKVN